MKSAVKLISINVEADKHTDEVLDFLHIQNPDVVCLQEVFGIDIPRYVKELGAEYFFTPMVKKPCNGVQKDEGIAILSKLPILDNGGAYYHRPHPEKILDYVEGKPELKRANIANCYLWADIQKNEDDPPIRIVTTHFTWTPDGQASEHQREDVVILLKEMERLGELVLCGDFNVPRRYNEIYEILTSKFSDAIPEHYKSSMDMTHHRVRKDPIESEKLKHFMVDYIFTTPAYTAKDVSLEFGISDHAAVVGMIESI